jgi:hypothetical protein
MGSCIVALFRDFHHTHEALVSEILGCGKSEFCLAVHVYSSDATNSSIWQQSKLMSTLVGTAYLCRPDDLDKSSWTECLKTFTAFADLQPVINDKGFGTYALLKKQLQSLEVPLWSECALGVEPVAPVGWKYRQPNGLACFSDSQIPYIVFCFVCIVSRS